MSSSVNITSSISKFFAPVNSTNYSLHSSGNNIIALTAGPGITEEHLDHLVDMTQKGDEYAARILQKMAFDRFAKLPLPEALHFQLTKPYLEEKHRKEKFKEFSCGLQTWLLDTENAAAKKKTVEYLFKELWLGARIQVFGGNVPIPPGLHLLENVTILYLKESKTLPDNFTFPPFLEKLHLRKGCSFTATVKYPPTLTTLQIVENDIPTLPSATQCPLLSYLHIENCALQAIPEGLEKFPLLAHLVFSQNQISQIPDAFAQFSKSVIIVLRKNPISLTERLRFQAIQDKVQTALAKPSIGARLFFHKSAGILLPEEKNLSIICSR